MQIDSYAEHFSAYFSSPLIRKQIDESVSLVRSRKRIFFLGNGGSNSICSHMMEDYGKIARIPSYAFSDAALITCYANDYGYEKAMEEWIKLSFSEGDLLVAISSSGESKNILNASKQALSMKGQVITLSGFKSGNSLSQLGHVNFHLPVSNYGIVECFHQVILHLILDILSGTK
jgi:D-sedoheptulose 7-phosphate isomerase